MNSQTTLRIIFNECHKILSMVSGKIVHWCTKKITVFRQSYDNQYLTMVCIYMVCQEISIYVIFEVYYHTFTPITRTLITIYIELMLKMLKYLQRKSIFGAENKCAGKFDCMVNAPLYMQKPHICFAIIWYVIYLVWCWNR